MPKADGGWRRIHHLSHPLTSSVNDGIPASFRTLQYTRIEEIFDLVRQAGRGCYIFKRDLKDAFRMIPVAPEQRWLLGFTWEDRLYHENVLPFGLGTAPFIFNLVAEGLHWVLQSWLQWELLVHYLDDFILIIPAAPDGLSKLREAASGYTAVRHALGLLQNDSKDAQGTVVDTLGIEIDTIKMTARLSAKKLTKALSLVSAALSAGAIRLHEAQQLSGYLSFCSTVVRLGRTFLRRLWDFTATYRKAQSLRPLSDGAKADLTWWRDLLPYFNGVRLIDDPSRPIFHVFTDASNIAIGGFWYEGSPAETNWRPQVPNIPTAHAFAAPLTGGQSLLHINTTEILAIEVAFHRWAHHWRHGLVVLHTDNTTAEQGLLGGTTRSAGMDSLRQLLVLAAAYDIKLHPQRIDTKANTLADALSRLDFELIANLAPHWQFPFPSSPHGTLFNAYHASESSTTTLSCSITG